MRLAQAIPTVVISRTGQVVGIDGFERMVEGLEKVMTAKGATPEEARLASGMLRAPGVEGLLMNTVKAIWSVWVADWIGLDLEPGKDSAGFVPVNEAAPDGPKMRVRVEHRGASEEHPGAVSLASAVVLDGDAAVAMLRPMFDGPGDPHRPRGQHHPRGDRPHGSGDAAPHAGDDDQDDEDHARGPRPQPEQG